MAKDYIPRANVKFNLFQQNLVKPVVLNAATWGIPIAEANALAGASAVYGDLYKAISTKQSCTTAQRDAYKIFQSKYEKQIRKFVNAHLRDNKNIDHDKLMIMGVKVRGKKRKSRSAIADTVLLLIEANTGCRIRFICRLPEHEGKASLHPEADGVEIRYCIGTRPANFKECGLSVFRKKAHVRVELDITDLAKHIYAFARWVNLSNDAHSGPWSAMAKEMII